MKENSIVLARIPSQSSVAWPGIIIKDFFSSDGWQKPRTDDYPDGAYFVLFLNLRKDSPFPKNAWVHAQHITLFDDKLALPHNALPPFLEYVDQENYLVAVKRAAAAAKHSNMDINSNAVDATAAAATTTTTATTTHNRNRYRNSYTSTISTSKSTNHAATQPSIHVSDATSARRRKTVAPVVITIDDDDEEPKVDYKRPLKQPKLLASPLVSPSSISQPAHSTTRATIPTAKKAKASSSDSQPNVNAGIGIDIGIGTRHVERTPPQVPHTILASDEIFRVGGLDLTNEEEFAKFESVLMRAEKNVKPFLEGHNNNSNINNDGDGDGDVKSELAVEMEEKERKQHVELGDMQGKHDAEIMKRGDTGEKLDEIEESSVADPVQMEQVDVLRQDISINPGVSDGTGKGNNGDVASEESSVLDNNINIGGGGDGDLMGKFVIAKLADYPYWPGYVGTCTNAPHKGKHKYRDQFGKTLYWVYFLNSYTGDWVYSDDIREFNDVNLAIFCPKKRRNADLQGAVDETRDRMYEESLGLFRSTVQLSGYGQGNNNNNSNSNKLGLNDLMLAKHEAYPPWPVIIAPDMYGKWKARDTNDVSVHVVFLGETPRTTSWVNVNSITNYTKAIANFTTVRDNNILYKDYTRAIEEADKYVNACCNKR